MKKVVTCILVIILCFCGSIVAQAEWMVIEKNVPELGISFSFPISNDSLYQQRMYVLKKKDDGYDGWIIPEMYGNDWKKTVETAMEEASEKYESEITCAWEFDLMDSKVSLTMNYPKYIVAIWSMEKPDKFDEPESYMKAMREVLDSGVGLGSREQLLIEQLEFGEYGNIYRYTAETSYGIVTYPILGMHLFYNDKVLLIEVSMKTVEGDLEQETDITPREEMNRILYGIFQSLQASM